MEITSDILKQLGFKKYLNPHTRIWSWGIGTNTLSDSPLIEYNLSHHTTTHIRTGFVVITRHNIDNLWELEEFVKCIQFLYPDISDKIQLSSLDKS